jgi:tetratricopeptide (TPR) repeat protein
VSENARIEQLRRRVRSDPASIAFAALAEEYRRDGRYAEAIEICRVGLQRHPAYLSARVTLGRALIGIGDLEAARLELEAVLRVAPENLAAIRAMADIYSQLPDIEALSYEEATGDQPIALSVDVAPPVDAPAAAVAMPAPAAETEKSPAEPESAAEAQPHSNGAAISRLEHFLAAIVNARAGETGATRGVTN